MDLVKYTMRTLAFQVARVEIEGGELLCRATDKLKSTGARIDEALLKYGSNKAGGVSQTLEQRQISDALPRDRLPRGRCVSCASSSREEPCPRYAYFQRLEARHPAGNLEETQVGERELTDARVRSTLSD
jgi:hypothetical protein